MSDSEQHKIEQPIQSTNQPKKLNSYTYWVDQKNKSRDLPPEQRPKKIEQPTLQNKTSEDGRSNWNTAGTWQHRKIDLKQIENDYTQLLNNWITEQDPTLKINSVSLHGECEIIFTRNKKALTYELDGKVEFQKKLPQQKEEKLQKKEEVTEKSNEKDQLNKDQPQPQKEPKLIEQVSSASENSEQKSPQKKQQEKKQQIKKKPKAKKPKPQTLTFEVKQLSDHGDRQYSSKADNKQDQKWIKTKSQNLMKLLQSVLTKYK